VDHQKALSALAGLFDGETPPNMNTVYIDLKDPASWQ